MQITTYDHFIYELFGDLLELCSLKVGSRDLGHRLRFTVPERKHPIQPLYETVQIRFFPPATQMPSPGWNGRRLVINAGRGTYRRGPWQKIELPDFNISHLPGPRRWLSIPYDLDCIGYPKGPRYSEPTLNFDENEIVYCENDRENFIKLRDLVYIYIYIYKHWSAVWHTEIPPVIMSFGLADGSETRITVSSIRDASKTSFNYFLVKRFGIAPHAIDSICMAQRNQSCALWNNLPQLEVAADPPLDTMTAARGFVEWLSVGAIGPIQLGPIKISDASARKNEAPFDDYPPKSAKFRFASINGESVKSSVVSTLGDALKAGNPLPILHPKNSLIFDWKTEDIEVEIFFNVYGKGWIHLCVPAYLAYLRSTFPEPGAPVVEQSVQLEFVVESIGYHGIQKNQISPRLDSLISQDRVSLWSAKEYQGFSYNSWSLRWPRGGLSAIELEQDICHDRGGPYEYLKLTLADGGYFSIRTKGSVDIDIVRRFFGKLRIGMD